MRLDWTLDAVGDVTLVSLHLQNDTAVPRRVRIENRLDGPVLPPRRRGHPEPGWDEDGVDLSLGPGEAAGLGYACHAPIRDDLCAAPPVEIVVDEPATSLGAGSGPGSEEPTNTDDAVAQAIRNLGESRPPRAAVPSGRRSADSSLSASPPLSPTSSPPLSSSSQTRPSSSGTDAGDDCDANDESIPVAVDAWLDAVATRVRLAEGFDGASVRKATTTLREVGGVDGATRLSEQVDEDTEALQRVADRASSLAARAESATVPVETLRRLA